MKPKINSRFTAAIVFLVSAGNLAVFWALRPVWYFVNRDLTGNGLFPLSWMLFALMAAGLALSAWRLASRRGRRWPLVAALSAGALFLAFNAFLCTQLGSSERVLGRNLRALLPEPPARLSFTAQPSIQRLGSGGVVVTWATNRDAIGWVEATAGGVTARHYPGSDGLRGSPSRLHAVALPVTAETTLVAVARQSFGAYENWAELGRERRSAAITVRPEAGNAPRDILVLPDTHESDAVYRAFLSGRRYELLVLGGDALTSVDDGISVAEGLLRPLGRYAPDTPFLLVRGNHETRGAGAGELSRWLGQAGSRYYRGLSIGNLFALILDSGEDKADGHPEYGGLVDFDAYLERETEWLRALAESFEPGEYAWRVAFVHIPLDEAGSPDDAAPILARVDEWKRLLERMRIQLVVSGHTHEPRIAPAGAGMPFPIAVGAGPYGRPDEYRAVRIRTGESAMTVELIRADGTASDSLTVAR